MNGRDAPWISERTDAAAPPAPSPPHGVSPEAESMPAVSAALESRSGLAASAGRLWSAVTSTSFLDALAAGVLGAEDVPASGQSHERDDTE
jgi:hypothetical protein